MTISKVGVVGLGTMGAGIAQVCAQAGYDVFAVDVEVGLLERGRARIESSLARLVKRERITERDAEATLARIDLSTERDRVSQGDLVIEAVYEDVPLKQQVLREIEKICGPDVLLASNTSTIPIVLLAMGTSRPTRIAGLHFFNPVPMMQLVEVVHTPLTAPEVLETLDAFITSVGKTPVRVADNPGFVGNLLIVPYLNDAIRTYERGVASMESIDTVMRLGFSHPMGPFELADLIGLDIVHDMAASMYEEYKDARYQPPVLLKQKVRMGQLGRKTGQGFYNYDKGAP